MLTEKELTDDLKLSISDFCQRSFSLISKDHPRARSICIQFNNDKTYVGVATGVYDPCYFNPDGDTNDQFMTSLVTEKTDTMKKCKKHIDDSYPNNKLRSFNIFYNGKTKTINICKNMIGNRGMTRCRLFNEFIYE